MTKPISKNATLEERLSRYTVDPVTGCWNWGLSSNAAGYGQVQLAGGVRAVHRAAYELWVGPVAEGLWVLHHCDNRRCMNPAHLYEGSSQDNVDDMTARSRHGNTVKTHCKRGHSLSGANLYVEPGRPRKRNCRACQTSRQSAR